MSDLIYKYWGKARPSSKGGAQYHLLPYRCLDVAAVGRAYLQKQPRLMRLFCQNLALPSAVTLDWLTFLLALHDLGKFSEVVGRVAAGVTRRIRVSGSCADKQSEK